MRLNGTIVACGVGLILGGAGGATAGLEPGVDRAAIFRELGAPAGIMELPSRTVYFYPHAELTLVDGVLTEAVWKSPEVVALEAAHRERVRAEHDAWQQTLAEERRERGERILATRRADPVFQNRPVSERMRLWAEFMRDYPQVDASAEYETVLSEYRVEQEQSRVRLAEAAAAAAERQKLAGSGGSFATGGLVDTVTIGRGSTGWGYYPPMPTTTVVVAGNNCPTVYPVYPNSCNIQPSKPILSVNYQGSRGSFQFEGGGGAAPLTRRSLTPPARPVVIIQRQ